MTRKQGPPVPLSGPEMSRLALDLPIGWDRKPLAELTTEGAPILYGILQPGPDIPGGIPYVRPTEIVEDLIDLPSVRRTTPTIAAKYKRSVLNPDDVILSIVGTIGKVAVVPPELDGGNITQSSVRIRPDPGVLSARYLAWALRSPVLRRQFDSFRLGTAVPRLNVAHVRALYVPFPSLVDQRRIVEEIERQLTRLRAGVLALRRLQANLKRYRAAVFKCACEGRLVPTEAELARKEGRQYESAKELIARTPAPPRPNRWSSRSKDVVPGHAALAVGNPRTNLPEGWTWTALVEIARMESGHTPSRSHPEWWGGDVAWIGIADARNHNGRTIHETIQHTNLAGIANSASRLLPAGTVCVSRTASVGYVVIMGREMATSQDFVNWIPTYAVKSSWLQLIFSADREALRGFGKGSVHKTIYFPEWLSVHVALPPLAEQTRIVSEVERRLSVVERMDAMVSVSLKRAAQLRQSILQRAFTGGAIPHSADEMTPSFSVELAEGVSNDANPATSKLGQKGEYTMPSRPAANLAELIEVLEAIGGAAAPDHLLAATGMADDIETFFDLLREGRNTGALSVPVGISTDVVRKSHAN
jgi:type I restriction enzyme S subunit